MWTERNKSWLKKQHGKQNANYLKDRSKVNLLMLVSVSLFGYSNILFLWNIVMKNILLAITGASPQVVTVTLYALHTEAKTFPE